MSLEPNRCCPYCGWSKGAITKHKGSDKHAHLPGVTYYKCGICRRMWRPWDREI
jgi:hypothetical protein